MYAMSQGSGSAVAAGFAMEGMVRRSSAGSAGAPDCARAETGRVARMSALDRSLANRGIGRALQRGARNRRARSRRRAAPQRVAQLGIGFSTPATVGREVESDAWG